MSGIYGVDRIIVRKEVIHVHGLEVKHDPAILDSGGDATETSVCTLCRNGLAKARPAPTLVQTQTAFPISNFVGNEESDSASQA